MAIPLLGPTTLNRFREFMGRDPHPSGAGREIYHMASPRHAGMRFEWHPRKRRVYLIAIKASELADEHAPAGEVREVGEVIAFDIETHGDAINAVNIFLRGYAEGRRPDLPKLHLRD